MVLHWPCFGILFCTLIYVVCVSLHQDMHLAKRFYDMAAEASVDAQIPVALALAKLAFLFSFKYLEDVSFKSFNVVGWIFSVCSTYLFGRFYFS